MTEATTFQHARREGTPRQTLGAVAPVPPGDEAVLRVAPFTVKMLREYLCTAQNTVYSHRASDALGHLIAECDRHRPLGSDGKHDDRHTATCGCEAADEVVVKRRDAEWAGRVHRDEPRPASFDQAARQYRARLGYGRTIRSKP